VPYSIDEVLSLDFNSTEKRNKFHQLGKTLPFVPCTPLGCLHLIQKTESENGEDIIGKNAVIFGNSNLVSKPMARLLLQSGATTTTLHSRSKNFDNIVENADIVVSATGKKQELKNIKKSAILIDVGIHKISGQDGIFGDLDFQEIVKTNRITPVPKGVGPMTVATLMVNGYLSALKFA
jgi:methylenetetrahydrofolate dehydrogenase (NADP+)/methenyltetrahydrofolate cyclohydrolase